MAGFSFAYRLSGGAPTLMTLPVAANAVLSVGELCNLESGYLDGGATNDAAFVGIALENVNATGLSSGDVDCKVIIDPDAVYAVTDANARVAGATLDIASGAMGVAASSNVDLIVVAPSTASEKTLVMIAHGEHYLN